MWIFWFLLLFYGSYTHKVMIHKHIFEKYKIAPPITDAISCIIMHIYSCNEKCKSLLNKVSKESLSTVDILSVCNSRAEMISLEGSFYYWYMQQHCPAFPVPKLDLPSMTISCDLQKNVGITTLNPSSVGAFYHAPHASKRYNSFCFCAKQIDCLSECIWFQYVYFCLSAFLLLYFASS